MCRCFWHSQWSAEWSGCPPHWAVCKRFLHITSNISPILCYRRSYHFIIQAKRGFYQYPFLPFDNASIFVYNRAWTFSLIRFLFLKQAGGRRLCIRGGSICGCFFVCILQKSWLIWNPSDYVEAALRHPHSFCMKGRGIENLIKRLS